LSFLKDGELHVLRHDATQLLEIKNGLWSLEKVQREADYLFKRAEQAYDNSTLPLHINVEKINNLTKQILGEYLVKQI